MHVLHIVSDNNHADRLKSIATRLRCECHHCDHASVTSDLDAVTSQWKLAIICAILSTIIMMTNQSVNQ